MYCGYADVPITIKGKSGLFYRKRVFGALVPYYALAGEILSCDRKSRHNENLKEETCGNLSLSDSFQ